MSDYVAMPVAGVRLSGATTWPAWYQQLRAFCQSKVIWAEVNPKVDTIEATSFAPPTRPVKPDTTSETEGKAYDRALAEWRSDHTEWTNRMAKHGNVRNWITTTVDAELLTAALMEISPDDDSEPTNQKLVHALMAELEPNSTTAITSMRMEYRRHLDLAKLGTMEPREWYRQWKTTYLKAKAMKLAEIDGQLGALDLLASLMVKYEPQWASNLHDQILAAGLMGGTVPSLSQVGQLFSQKLEDHAMRYPVANGVHATFGGSTPNRSTASKPKEPKPLVSCPCSKEPVHSWSAATCGRLRSALTGAPYTPRGKPPLAANERQPIIDRLHQPRNAELRKEVSTFLKLETLLKKAPAPVAKQTPGGEAGGYPGSIVAALIDPALMEAVSSGVYATMSFDAHPLSKSTLLDNGAALHLVNSKELLVEGSFQKSTRLETVEAGTQAFPISGKGTRMIKGLINGPRGARTEDLTLHNVVVVEGFHVNIISEARLRTSNVWYCGFDATLRSGSLTKNYVLMSLERHHNLTFVEYNLLKCYPDPKAIMSVTPEQGLLKSWATHPRLDTEELWHSRGGHLAPEALRALVYATRGVRLHGTARLRCEHCAVTHAKQCISRRPRERAPRPYYRISWDLFDMPRGRIGEQWLLIIKDDFSGKIHLYVITTKGIFEIMRVFRHFASWVYTQYHLKIAKVRQDNDQSTLPWRGTSEFIDWCYDEGMDIEPSPPHTHEPNGAAERAGQEVVTKALKMRLGAGLPEKLWPEVTQAAVWLYNMSPAYRNGLRSPNEVLLNWFQQYFKYYQPAHVRSASADLRPDWSGIYAYGCRAYPLNRDREAGRRRRDFKVSPRGHIGYLVGYKASNIYRIWVPTLEQVITTRNVAFDEELFFKEKKDELPKAEAVKIVDVLQEEELRDAGQAFLPLPTASNEQQEETAPIQTPPDDVGGGGAEAEAPVVGPPQENSDASANSRAAPWAGEQQGIREVRKDEGGQLPSPEPTPEPEARGGGEPGNSRNSGGMSSHGLPRQEPQGLRSQRQESHEEPMGSSTADQDDPDHSVSTEETQGAAIPAAAEKQKQKRTRKVFEKTRSSARQRGDGPDDTPPPAAAAHVLLDDRGAWLLRGALDAPIQDEHVTIHHVVASSTQKQGRLHRDQLAKLPKRWRDLHAHPHGGQFKAACGAEIKQLIAKDTWKEVERAPGDPRPLPLMWVFTYKWDEDGYLLKCKARLVVRGDMQPQDMLHSTYAATLAARSFRLAMAIAAEFDLEIWQGDVVGAFLNALINKRNTVLCELPEGYQKPGKAQPRTVRPSRLATSVVQRVLWHTEEAGTRSVEGGTVFVLQQGTPRAAVVLRRRLPGHLPQSRRG
jgi:hypothetical protein